VIPVPFNQPTIATPPIPPCRHSPTSRTTATAIPWKPTTVATEPGSTDRLPSPTAACYQANYEGGNDDLRVPYIGYAAESISYKAAGVDAYNALQAHVEKRMSHGIQVGRLLHLLARPRRAERPGPLLQRQQCPQPAQRLRFVRLRPHPRHQLQLRLPGSRLRQQAHAGRQGRRRMVAGGPGRAAERPALQHHRLLRRHRQHLLLHLRRHHQPHRAAGQGLHGQERADRPPAHGRRPAAKPALNAACFTLPLLAAGGLGGAIPNTDPFETGFTTGQRNIFRQSFQKRADASLVKVTPSPSATT
jgi:hypothetical protein